MATTNKLINLHSAYATSSPSPSSAIDPSLTRAQDLLESGTRALEDGDISTARNLYKESVEVKESSEGWHNLAVGVLLSSCYLVIDLSG